MLLRNQEIYLDALQIDVARDVRERQRLNSDNNASCDGCFFEHNGSLFVLGAESGAMYVILNGQLRKYDDTLETQLVASPECNTFTATQDSRELCRVEYTPQRASRCVPNEDDECIDGFLWMHNVLRSPERRSILIANEGNDG